MMRPKSAGGSRSFLDDLLNDDINDLPYSTSSRTPSAVQRQRKSVRFFDQDDQPQNEDNNTRQQRARSSTLDYLLNKPKSESSKASNKSQSDWLGLGTDDKTKSINNRINLNEQKSSNVEQADWITAGLRARQSRPKDTNVTSIGSSNEPKTWQPKVLDSTPIEVTSNKVENQAPKVDPIVSTPQVTNDDETTSKLDVKIETIKHQTENEKEFDDTNSQSAVYLQTKAS